MTYRADTVFTYVLPSSTTLGSAIDIGQGWRTVALELPTMNSVADVFIHGSPSSNGTFTRITENAGVFYQVFSKTMSSGGTLTAQYDLQRPWDEVWLDKPTFSTNTAIYMHAAIGSGLTFTRLAVPNIQTSVMQTNDWVIQSGTSARMVQCPNSFRYIKLEFGSGVTDVALSMNVYCVDKTSQRFRDFQIPSGTSGRIVPIPAPYENIKIELSTAHTSALTFNVICRG
jgi:hypothetical protein